MNSEKVKEFIRENGPLFWYIKEDAREEISNELLVETILNYGNEKSVGKLFELLGLQTVAGIFYRQVSRERVNYKPRTVNFFDLYFKRHAQGNFSPKAS